MANEKNNPKKSILPLSGREIPERKQAVKTTIVGGQPSENGRELRDVPVGIEGILAMAAVDDKFADALLKDRPSAVKASGIELAETEKHVFAAVDNAALSQMIEKMRRRIPEKSRPVFMRKSAAALLALVGTGLLSSGVLQGCDGFAGSKGIRADDVKKDDDSPRRAIQGALADRPESVPQTATAGIMPDIPEKKWGNESKSWGIQPDRPEPKSDSAGDNSSESKETGE
jgi:hypothetical protein